MGGIYMNKDTDMIIKILTDSGEETRIKVKMTHAHGCVVMEDRNGCIYGSGDWFRRRCSVVFAAPHERAAMPEWMIGVSDITLKDRPSDSSRYIVYENDEFTITEKTSNGMLIVTSSGISTPQNATMNTASTIIVGNMRPGRDGMIIDLSELDGWQEPDTHVAHMRGYPRTVRYAGNFVFVCRSGVDRHIAELNAAVSAPRGYCTPQYFTSVPEATDYLRSI
jgi:hypothetical protein